MLACKDFFQAPDGVLNGDEMSLNTGEALLGAVGGGRVCAEANNNHKHHRTAMHKQSENMKSALEPN